MRTDNLRRRGGIAALILAALAAAPLPSRGGSLADDYRLHPRTEGQWTLPGTAALRGAGNVDWVARDDYAFGTIDGDGESDGFYVIGEDGQVGFTSAAPFRSVTTSDDPDCVWVGGVDAVYRMDVSDPEDPQIAETIPLPGAGDVRRVACEGSLLLANGTNGRFRVVLVGPCGPAGAVDAIPGVPGGAIISDIGGSFAAFVGPNSLTTVNLAEDPMAPVTISVPGTTHDVVVDFGGNVVLAGSYGAKTYTINGAGAPIPTADYPGFPNLRNVAHRGNPNRLAFRNASNDIHLVDVDQPGPGLTRMATVSGPGGGSGLSSSSGITIVPFVDVVPGSVGVTRIGHGDSRSPSPHQILTDLFIPRVVHRIGNVVIVIHAGGGGGVEFLDATDPVNLTSFGTADSVAAPNDLDLFRWPSDLRTGPDFRDFALVGTLLDLRVVEFTDPTNPAAVGVLAGSSSRVACTPDGSLAVRTDNTPGFRVVDLSDPASPFDRGTVSLPNAADDLLLDGTRAIVASFNQTARFDLSDPDAPVLEHATPYTGVRGVALAGVPDQAYLGIPDAGGRVVRYDFAAQAELSSVNVGANTLAVTTGTSAAADGAAEIVYAAEYLGGSIFVIDWTDPADPVLLGEYTEPGLRPSGLAPNGETLIAADNAFPGRVLVLPAQGPTLPGTSAPVAFEAASTVTLAGGAPNPFATSTTLELTLARRGNVRLTVHDLHGRRVRTLASESLPAGRHALAWDGHDAGGTRVASGVYFVRLEAQGRVERRKVTMLR